MKLLFDKPVGYDHILYTIYILDLLCLEGAAGLELSCAYAFC